MANANRSPERLLTLQEFIELPEEDGWRDELVRGRLVREPAPASQHGRVVVRLGRFLDEYADAAGGLVVADTGYILERRPPATVRVPDLSFIARDRTAGYPASEMRDVPPDLAVEVLSPSNRPAEMRQKIADYFAAGLRLVWVVDPHRRTVAVHASPTEAHVLPAHATLDGGAVLPGFRLPLATLFSR
jgi:Uma2 family endonuclease